MIKHMVSQACSLVAVILVPATVWAHPGHGVVGDDWSVRHYLTEPDHVLSGLALLLVGAVVWRLVRAAIRARNTSASPKDPR